MGKRSRQQIPLDASVFRHALPLFASAGARLAARSAGEGRAASLAAGAVAASILSTVLLSLARSWSSPWLSPAWPFLRPAAAWRRSVAVAALPARRSCVVVGLLSFRDDRCERASLVHCFALCYLGVQPLLCCRESRSGVFSSRRRQCFLSSARPARRFVQCGRLDLIANRKNGVSIRPQESNSCKLNCRLVPIHDGEAD